MTQRIVTKLIVQTITLLQVFLFSLILHRENFLLEFNLKIMKV